MIFYSRLVLFLFFLAASSLNFLALVFLAIYHDIGNAMLGSFSVVWMWFIAFQLPLSLLIARRFTKEFSAMIRICRLGLSGLKFCSVFAFSIGLFQITRFLLDNWTNKDVVDQLIVQQEAALVSLVLGLLFMRCSWTIETDEESIYERFSLFLFTSSHSYLRTEPGPRFANLISLLLLAMLVVMPSVSYHNLLERKSFTTEDGDRLAEQQELFQTGLKLEKECQKAPQTRGVSFDEDQVRKLVEALSCYQKAEEKGEEYAIPDFMGSSVDNCRLAQARVLTKLGQYEKALAILERHRISYPERWSQAGRINDASAPMPVKDFVLVYWKTGNSELALRTWERYLGNTERGPHLSINQPSFDELRFLLLVDQGEWDEAAEELEMARATRNVCFDNRLELFRSTLKERNQNVRPLLE